MCSTSNLCSGPLDIEHMDGFGIDLGTYEGVKEIALMILTRLRSADEPTPPQASDGPWPDEWIALFARWIAEGYPQ
jgi:hypothetical protein